MTFFLRFADEAEYQYHKEYIGGVVDVIGTLYDVIEEDEAVALDGYHVNMLEQPDPALHGFLVYPRNPRRVFFGASASQPLE